MFSYDTYSNGHNSFSCWFINIELNWRMLMDGGNKRKPFRRKRLIGTI